jgi:peptidoglycan/xylan/chitin deacetylase (PgdA/CDA1 family)
VNFFLDASLRSITSMLSPRGDSARLTIVTFHRVLEKEDPLQPDLPCRAQFERKLSWLTRQFRILPLAQACNQLFEGILPSRSACISFDDGYKDNLSNALPALERLQLPATVFVATGFQAGNNMFNDEIVESVRATRLDTVDAGAFSLGQLRLGTLAEKLHAINCLVSAVKYLPLTQRSLALTELRTMFRTETIPGLMLSSNDIKSLHHRGIEIGGHTRNHPILMRESDHDALQEIRACRSDIGNILGEVPQLFAFPNGKLDDDFTLKHCEMVQNAGFTYGFSTDPASATIRSNHFRLPRVSMWAESRLRNSVSLLNNLRKAP